MRVLSIFCQPKAESIAKVSEDLWVRRRQSRRTGRLASLSASGKAAALSAELRSAQAAKRLFRPLCGRNAAKPPHRALSFAQRKPIFPSPTADLPATHNPNNTHPICLRVRPLYAHTAKKIINSY